MSLIEAVKVEIIEMKWHLAFSIAFKTTSTAAFQMRFNPTHGKRIYPMPTGKRSYYPTGTGKRIYRIGKRIVAKGEGKRFMEE